MKNIIFCQATDKGVHSFYLVSGDAQYFLFNQKYRKGVQEYYGNGVLLNDAMEFKKSHNDAALMKTMNKIPMYLKYVESEYEIAVLNKTRQRNDKRNKYSEAFAA